MAAASLGSKQLARSLGAVVSDYLRQSMKPEEPAPAYRNGIRLLPKKGQTITLEMVNALRDDDV